MAKTGRAAPRPRRAAPAPASRHPTCMLPESTPMLGFHSPSITSTAMATRGKPDHGWQCPACGEVQGQRDFDTGQTRQCRGMNDG
eukprot:5553105-Prymnesium_polylepis.1